MINRFVGFDSQDSNKNATAATAGSKACGEDIRPEGTIMFWKATFNEAGMWNHWIPSGHRFSMTVVDWLTNVKNQYNI
jgi:hypothetical protein